MVIRKDLVEGMYYAMAKGEPLAKVMESFHNAGYSKAEVEESARYLQSLLNKQPIQQQMPQIKQPVKKQSPTRKPVQYKTQLQHQQPMQQQQKTQTKPKKRFLFFKKKQKKPDQQPQSVQQVQPQTEKQPKDVKPKKKRSWIGMAVLIILLILFIAALIASILFKPEIISFLEDTLA